MTTDLAQMINLTLAYNSNNLLVKNKFYANHNFRFFTSSDVKDDGKLYQFIDSPTGWLLSLKMNECQRLYIGYINRNNLADNYKTSAFVNGGDKWVTAAKYEDHIEYWASEWKVNDYNETTTTWNVSFHILKIDSGAKPVITLPNTVEKQKEELRTILTKISQFADEHQYTKYFVKDFQKSLKYLSDANVKDSYLSDLVPDNSLAVENQKLLIAAGNAIVFGGNGSWNDVGLEKNITYKKLTESLYKTINDSVLIAVNN